MDEAKPPGLKIGQIFLVKVQFEHREDFLSLSPKQEIEVEIGIQSATHVQEDGLKGLIAIAVETNNEKNPVYRFRIEMGAIVNVDESAPNLSVREYLEKQAPVMMMPFLREAVANITGRGRFGALWMNPVNMTMLATTDATPSYTEEMPGESSA